MVHPLAREVTAATAVLVERLVIDGPWQSQSWRAAAVEFDYAGGPQWRGLRTTSSTNLYRIGHVPMTLHAKEMMGYRVNFANGEPKLYVALQIRDFDPDQPVSVDLVTASALEVQAYGHTPESVTGSVPMPADILGWVQEFMQAQARETEEFVKRSRDRHPSGEDFRFGNIPIDQIRREAARRDANQPLHPALRGQTRRD